MTKLLMPPMGDGQKGITIEDIEDLDDLRFFQQMPQRDAEAYWARVAAFYRAAKMSAQTIAHIPFALMQGKTEYDASDAWENKVGFWKKPQQFLERVSLSLFFRSAAYGLMTRNIAGKDKNLYYIVPDSIRIVTDPGTGELVGLERRVNGRVVKTFRPDDPTLIRIWYLDHTTELLPTQNTRARAAMNAAGILYAQDFWVRNFFEGGGVKPTVIGAKGVMTPDARNELQKSWDKFVKFITRERAKVINAEALQVETFGDGVADMKDSKVKEEAVADVAMAFGMPLSLLLANSANEATATQEYRTWFRDEIIPDAEFLAEELNEQLFERMGLRLEFHPEATDPEQEDEVQRAQAVNTFVDFMNKCETKEQFEGICNTFGYELSDDLTSAVDKFFNEKKARQEEMQRQLSQGQPEPGQEAKPKPSPFPAKPALREPPQKFIPSVSLMRDLKTWQEVAERKLKHRESLEFEYKPHYGEIPDWLVKRITGRLYFCKSQQDVRTAFELEDEPAQGDDGLKHVADLLEKLVSNQAVPAT